MSKRKGGLLKFVAGVGIGVGAGMLLAPKKGEELRKDLKVKEPDALNNLYDLLERQFEDIKHQKDNIEHL